MILKPSAKFQELIDIYREMSTAQQEQSQAIPPGFTAQNAAKYRHDLLYLFEKHEIQTVLDYGGGGTAWTDETVPEGKNLVAFLGNVDVVHFEPTYDLLKKPKCDAVVSFDVLEHIFLGDVCYVLNDIFTHAKRLVYLVVACDPAQKTLSTGENAHITQRSAQWWKGAVDMTAVQYPSVSYRLICTRTDKPPKVFEMQNFDNISAAPGYDRPEQYVDIDVFGAPEAKMQNGLSYIKNGHGQRAAQQMLVIPFKALKRKHIPTYARLAGTLGATGHIDPHSMRRINRFLDSNIEPFLRYRAALKGKDISMAKTLRNAAMPLPNSSKTIGWHASVALLHLGHKRLGFRFYHNRLGADDGVVSWPKNAIHVPFDGKAFVHDVHLEQGVGDVFLHLAHLKSTGLDVVFRFHVTPRWEKLLRLFFPTCDVVVHPNWVMVPDGVQMHATGDFMVYQFYKTNTLRPSDYLLPAFDNRAGYGISWRGGAKFLNDTDNRKIALSEMLEALPPNQTYYCLQYDITQDEYDYIRKNRPDIRFPAGNMKSDLYGLTQLIRRLKGVISVRNSNLHIAGNCGISCLAFIDDTTSWLWSDQNKKVRPLYGKTRIHKRSDYTRENLEDWMQSVL